MTAPVQQEVYEDGMIDIAQNSQKKEVILDTEDEDDYDEGIDMAQYSKEQEAIREEEDLEGTIDMAEYAKSKEAEEATWWDAAKEFGVQSVLGLGRAFTWPLDVLKMAMVGDALSEADDLEDAFERAGKPFDKDKYIQKVIEHGEFIPTQSLLEKTIDKYAGTDIEHPKTRIGKAANKFFFLGGLTRGQGVVRSVSAGAVGAGTTAALREAGAPEMVSELAGDIGGGLATIRRQPRRFTVGEQEIIDVANRHGLPLMELMLEDTAGTSAKISPTRRAAIEKDLGMSVEEAVNEVVAGRMQAGQWRAQGHNLQAMEDEAFNRVEALARNNPTVVSTQELVNDINGEIARIRSGAESAPSLSAGDKASIRILQQERRALTKAPSKPGPTILGPDGQPINPVSNRRTPRNESVERLLNQTRKYNSNVTGLYRKAEYTGVEDDVRRTYAFLNERIANTVERNAGSEVIEAHRAANLIFGQNANLARVEGMLQRTFKNESMSPKKLNQLLTSRQGNILARDIGPDGVRELREIAEYGERALRATSQLATSARHKHQLTKWGPIAGFVLAKTPLVAGAAAVKPLWNYVRGYMLTRPVARQAYAKILRNAANGSFSTMAKDFATMEGEIKKEYGSFEDFIKQGMNDLQSYREGEEDEDDDYKDDDNEY